MATFSGPGLRGAGDFLARVGVPAAIALYLLVQLGPKIDDMVKASNYATWTLRELCKGVVVSGPVP